MTLIRGIDCDAAGRCRHYHQDNDIAALRCAQCGDFFACYQCHDALCDHLFVPSPKASRAVLCGNCGVELTFAEYTQGSCPQCQHAFNPNCRVHYNRYFQA
ncbi:MAG: CHY zinc finger protein [Lactobacillus sp.]|nr:CHY zinc finger protein [Lactobacillus sp.]MCI2032911.1 CHY zinc finger protein [Lactobacillus sp.]